MTHEAQNIISPLKPPAPVGDGIDDTLVPILNDDEEDECSDPYTDISSMSEDGGAEALLRASLNSNNDGNNGSNSSLEFNPEVNNLQSRSGSNSEKDGGDPKTHLLQLSHSHSSGNSNSNSNNDGSPHQLQCVTTTTHDKQQQAPSSPLGSVSVNSAISPTFKGGSMPRFYDSEEEGAGSLVFVGDAGSIVTRTHQSSASGLSPKLGPSSSNHNGNLSARTMVGGV